ncbi:hypothetical protein H5410_012222 [Solanum commersonii]|uniref:NAD(P)H dehydrogenase subunit H n=1 Tax=Solanum commersonii TaxID=4109 RepID=A0A9J6ARL3_SOLCO|nr:hypothetical protein H5410_012222 [Solanum commersonii]
MTAPTTRKDLMIVNMGPQHPSMHGVLRLIVTLDGEDVVDCEPILGCGLLIQEGSSVKATGRIAQIPVSEAYLGRVVNALAKPIDGRGEISASEF